MKAIRLNVNGKVQGVGFRPFVYVLATRLGLKGSVENGPKGVTISLYGDAHTIKQFKNLLSDSAPESCFIETITCQSLNIKEAPKNFSIKPSSSGVVSTIVPTDTSICSSCIRDMEDKQNRRFGYPFTHCSHCGPRFSILHAMPFDRKNTSMADFIMCEDCLAEYEDPKSRRFHNQANCCPQCGPQIFLENTCGKNLSLESSADTLDKAAAIIQSGGILALKGIGGFNLLCDAMNHSAIARLRQRKNRPAKALALMARDIEAVKQFTSPNPLEIELLESAQRPIVLLDSSHAGLPEIIAPKLNSLGFVLPYTALHILLMRRLDTPVVFTSANTSGAPQCITNSAAKSELNAIADYLLMHDRGIVNRVDDSVMQVVDKHFQTVRAGRGFSPLQFRLPEGFSLNESVIAMGAQSKNTLSFSKETRLVLSPPLDNLNDTASLKAYEEQYKKLSALYSFTPAKVVVDKHPQYRSTLYGEQLAEKLDNPVKSVLHHHAHLAACLFENGHLLDAPPVLGICFDGTGLGNNNEIWGAEFFLFNYQYCHRIASFETIPLLGGSLAITEPWRSAYAYLFGLEDFQSLSRRYQHLDIFVYFRKKSTQVLEKMMLKKINSPSASSAGRLFDAVAATLNVCRDKISYEGQAAIELQALAELAVTDQLPSAYPFDFNQGKPVRRLSWAKMWRAMLADLGEGVDKETIALRFHVTVVSAILVVIDDFLKSNKKIKVALSGGVFQNRLLVSMLSAEIEKRGLSVYLPLKTPCNDSGISVGQALVEKASKPF